MGPAVAAELLRGAVAALPPPEQANVRFHLAAGTRILCGPEGALLWSDGAGGCCPATMAAGREVPEDRVEAHRYANLWTCEVFRRMSDHAGERGRGTLYEALRALSEDEARAALEEAVGAA